MTDGRTGDPTEPDWDAADPMASFRRYAEYLHQRARGVFLKDGKHAEMVFLFRPGGECAIALVRGDRDEFAAGIRKIIRLSGVVGAVHVAEAWFHSGGPGDHVTKQIALGEMAVSDLRPEDRGEAIFVSAQGRDGWTRTWVEPILRDADGRPSLGDGFAIGEIGGRWARLFG